MTKVNVISAHGNAYGDKYQKSVGDSYDVPDDKVAALVRDGFVEIADPDSVKTKK